MISIEITKLICFGIIYALLTLFWCWWHNDDTFARANNRKQMINIKLLVTVMLKDQVHKVDKIKSPVQFF